MNRKERRKALFSVLSAKVKNNQLIIVNELKLKEIKTKLMADIFAKLPVQGSSLLAIAGNDKTVVKSSANLKNVKTIDVGFLNIHDLLKFKTLVLPQDALEKVNALAN